MRRMLSKPVFVIAALLFINFLASGADPTVPRRAPELAFNVPGQGEQLLSAYRGKVIALEFIFTTCVHCQQATRLMNTLQEQYGPRGFQALAVAVNDNADLLVQNFAKEFAVKFPVGWMQRQSMLTFMDFQSGYFVVPQIALIDRSGYVRYQTPPRDDDAYAKMRDEKTLRNRIEELLANKPNGSAKLHTEGAATHHHKAS